MLENVFKMIKGKKAGMELSIVLLVLATLVLVVSALFTFNFRIGALERNMKIYNNVEGVYAQAKILDFTLREIIVKFENNKNGEIIAFVNDSIHRYKNETYSIYGLQQVENQLNSEHIKAENGQVSAKFQIIFVDQTWDEKNPQYLDYKIKYTHNFVYP